MAYRRSITARAKQLYEQYRVAPSFSTHIQRNDNSHENLPHDRPISNNPQIPNYFQRRLFGTGNNLGTFHGSRNFFNDRRFSIPAASGPAFVMNMSSLGKGPTEKIEMADVLDDKAVEVAAQVPSKQIQRHMNILRPLSPHLPIYKPQLTSTFSIFHRFSFVFLTTIVLFFYLLYLKIGLICFTYENVYQIFFYLSKLIPISVALTALALSYQILWLCAEMALTALVLSYQN